MPQGKVVVIASTYVGILSTSLGSLLVQMMKLVFSPGSIEIGVYNSRDYGSLGIEVHDNELH